MITAFVSDLHLSPERPAIAEAFTNFLRGGAAGANSLYILGDLFEFWAGDDTLDEPFNHAVAAALRDLHDDGVAVHVMHGNRDFLLGPRFAAASGARLLADTAVIDLYGERTLLMHGDTLCTEDRRYQAFRAKVRRPAVQKLFLSLPRSLRLAIARRARRLSEHDKARKQMRIMDVTPAAVVQALRTSGCRRLIHGHTHKPASHAHDVDGVQCERIVLADWYEHGEYLRCDAQGFTRQTLS